MRRALFALALAPFAVSLSNGCSAPAARPALVDDSRISVQHTLTVEAMRAALIDYLWRADGFPVDKLPAAVERGVAPPIDGLDGLYASVDLYAIEMDGGFVSYAWRLRPVAPRHRLLVFHHGHADDLASDGGAQSIAFFLQNGYDVIALYMLDYGPDAEPLPSHDAILADGTPRPYSAMKLFVEPVAVALNQALAEDRFDVVAMMGVSGGGWTTTVYAALDPRVQYSFPVAGSLPLYLRTRPQDVGDAEQFFAPFYRIAGYPDLYVMGAAGKGRRQVQVLNEFDPCCFTPDVDLGYVSAVAADVKRMRGHGTFALAIDRGQTDHTISDWTLRSVIFPSLEDTLAPSVQ